MTRHMRSTTAAGRSDPAIQPDVRREWVASSTGLAMLAYLLFASGTAALVYQVLWIKQLPLVVGVVERFASSSGPGLRRRGRSPPWGVVCTRPILWVRSPVPS